MLSPASGACKDAAQAGGESHGLASNGAPAAAQQAAILPASLRLRRLTRRRMKGARVWVALGEGLGLPATLFALPMLPTEVPGPMECETCSCRPLPPTGAALLLLPPPAAAALLLLVRQLLGCQDLGSMLLTPPLLQHCIDTEASEYDCFCLPAQQQQQRREKSSRRSSYRQGRKPVRQNRELTWSLPTGRCRCQRPSFQQAWRCWQQPSRRTLSGYGWASRPCCPQLTQLPSLQLLPPRAQALHWPPAALPGRLPQPAGAADKADRQGVRGVRRAKQHGASGKSLHRKGAKRQDGGNISSCWALPASQPASSQPATERLPWVRGLWPACTAPPQQPGTSRRPPAPHPPMHTRRLQGQPQHSRGSKY